MGHIGDLPRFRSAAQGFGPANGSAVRLFLVTLRTIRCLDP